MRFLAPAAALLGTISACIMQPSSKANNVDSMTGNATHKDHWPQTLSKRDTGSQGKGDCGPSLLGTAPLPIGKNRLKAFESDPIYNHYALNNSKAPSNYSIAFTNYNSTVWGSSFLKDTILDSYNVNECAVRCTEDVDCQAFNIYIAGDLSRDPGSNCPNPPTVFNFKCALYSERFLHDAPPVKKDCELHASLDRRCEHRQRGSNGMTSYLISSHLIFRYLITLCMTNSSLAVMDMLDQIADTTGIGYNRFITLDVDGDIESVLDHDYNKVNVDWDGDGSIFLSTTVTRTKTVDPKSTSTTYVTVPATTSTTKCHKSKCPKIKIPTITIPTIKIPTTKIHTVKIPTTKTQTVNIPTTKTQTVKILTTKTNVVKIPTTKTNMVKNPTTKTHTVKISTTKIHTVKIPTTKSHKVKIPTTKTHTVKIPTTKSHTVKVPTTKTHTVKIPTTKSHTVKVPTTKTHTVKISTTKFHTVKIPTTKFHTVKIPTTKFHIVKISTTKTHTIKIPTTKIHTVKIPKTKTHTTTSTNAFTTVSMTTKTTTKYSTTTTSASTTKCPKNKCPKIVFPKIVIPSTETPTTKMPTLSKVVERRDLNAANSYVTQAVLSTVTTTIVKHMKTPGIAIENLPTTTTTITVTAPTTIWMHTKTPGVIIGNHWTTTTTTTHTHKAATWSIYNPEPAYLAALSKAKCKNTVTVTHVPPKVPTPKGLALWKSLLFANPTPTYN
ncbi:hypothetical protein CC78DRAFT_583334 [Lojkania enalia]|uniref:Apple domain-containing protein n=1 Tax=Lojkania enalia TaxID=147567 RepID=A0A9P4K4Q6_9PLEO|nr:hypothetical protein CC78DRAFT_583334 [Didymosphaeria enalia]